LAAVVITCMGVITCADDASDQLTRYMTGCLGHTCCTHARTHARTHTHMHTHTHTIRVFTTIPVNIYHSCDISVCYVTAHLNHLTLVLTHPYGGYTCVRYVSLWLSISFLAKAGICSQLSNRHFISEEL